MFYLCYLFLYFFFFSSPYISEPANEQLVCYEQLRYGVISVSSYIWGDGGNCPQILPKIRACPEKMIVSLYPFLRNAGGLVRSNEQTVVCYKVSHVSSSLVDLCFFIVTF